MQPVLKARNSHISRTLDISLGGCFVKTHAYFANDEIVTLEFSLFERPMKCTGGGMAVTAVLERR